MSTPSVSSPNDIADAVANKKRCLKSSEVDHIWAPQYEGLSLESIAWFLGNGFQHVFEYLPDWQEIHLVSKAWIVNVCGTLLGQVFIGWADQQIEV